MTEPDQASDSRFLQSAAAAIPAAETEADAAGVPHDHYIPLRKSDLVRILTGDTRLHGGDAGGFPQLCRLLSATIHFHYHDCLEKLKDLYDPVNPDTPVWEQLTVADENNRQSVTLLFERFTALLERANYRPLSRAEINHAIGVASDWGVRLHVDFSVFERLEVYVRGDVIDRRSRRRWQTRYRIETVDVPVYQRLVVMFQLRHREFPDDPVCAIPVRIKVFKNIPKTDIDMLLPGTRFAMSLLDRGRILLPTITGLSIAVLKIVRGALLLAFAGVYGILAVLGLVGGTVGYGVKSFFGYLRTKEKYQLCLTRSLYYQNLDNNAGVICRILDEAEEQELVEMLLAYALLLWRAGETGWTADQLDQEAESYLSGVLKRNVDFEVHDALEKLERFGCASRVADERWRATPMEAALLALDRAWDDYFRYNHDASPPCTSSADVDAHSNSGNGDA